MEKMLITSIILQMFSFSSATDYCSDAWPGMFVSDPDNCHKFFECSDKGDPNPAPGLCSDGGCFHPIVGSCLDADDNYCIVNCLDGTIKTTASTTQTTTTTTSTTTMATTQATITTTTPSENPTSSTPKTSSVTVTAPKETSIPISSSTSTSPVTIPRTDSTSTTTSQSTTLTTLTTLTTQSPHTSSTTTTKTKLTTPKPVMCGNDIQDTKKADPTDCGKFFICTSSGQWSQLQCPSDSCFFPALNICYKNTPFCTSFCGVTTVSSESTTSTTQKSTSILTDKITATSTTMTTPSTNIPNDCLDVENFVCPKKGYFTKCNYCTEEYFSCSGPGTNPMVGKCPGSLMFNPDHAYPYCLLPTNCPMKPIVTTMQPPSPTQCLSANEFKCPGEGYFAKCNFCAPHHFHCNRKGEAPTERKCSGSLMFNPDPKYPICLLASNCPYTY